MFEHVEPRYSQSIMILLAADVIQPNYDSNNPTTIQHIDVTYFNRRNYRGEPADISPRPSLYRHLKSSEVSPSIPLNQL